MYGISTMSGPGVPRAVLTVSSKPRQRKVDTVHTYEPPTLRLAGTFADLTGVRPFGSGDGILPLFPAAVIRVNH
jgi:hypothetical protein